MTPNCRSLALATLVTFGVATSAASVGAAPPGGASPSPDTAVARRSSESARRELETSWRATVSISRATGMASSVRFPRDGGFAVTGARSAGDGTAEFFRRYGRAFGVADAAKELSLSESQSDQLGMQHLSYKQLYKGVEVFGGVLRVHVDAEKRIRSVNGTFVPAIDLSTDPRLEAAAAAAAAIADVVAHPPVDEATGQPVGVAAANLQAASNKLYVYQEGLTQGIPGPVRLVYYVEVADGGAVREFVFVDAHSGKVVNRISGIHQALHRRVSEVNLATVVWDEGLGDPDPIPAGWAGGSATQVASWNDEIDGAKEIYNLLSNLTGGTYLSYDGADAVMRTVNNDGTFTPSNPCPNAHWTGVFTGYCTGVTSDDVVAHEWEHAYTQFTHGLVYQWQPGALNEAYSDIWGETVDLLNGRGTDAPGPLRSDGACSSHTANPPDLIVNSPASIAGTYVARGAAFGPAIPAGGVTQDLVLADDGAGVVTNACEPLVNAGAIAGNIALIDRGTCSFVIKVKNAQNAGAIAVVVANNVAGAPPGMGGTDPTITIPSISVSQATGDLLKAELGTGVNVTLAPPPPGEDSFRWLMGEDSTAFGGAIRDMWSPGCTSDPAKVIDGKYFCATDDGGGVHSNSGVPNHGYALLVDGGTYNGQTVAGIGLTKAAHIYWRAQSVYQTLASGFPEHADALEQSCDDLIGAPLEGLSTGAPIGPSVAITAADCDAVDAMTLAVELRGDPTAQCGFTPLLDLNAPALCANTPNLPTTIFLEDFEVGLGGFTVSNQGVYGGWPPLDWVHATTLPGGRAGSAAFGPDPNQGDCAGGANDISGVMRLESPDIVIPAAGTPPPLLAFDHYVATEEGWDGGNLRISINAGPFTQVPAAAFTFNPYNLTLNPAPNNTNPLEGQDGFSGSDSGSVLGSWGQSQVDLGPAGVSPGDTIRLRYDLGIDGCGGLDGWYVDDVRVYTCEPVVCGNGTLEGPETCDDGGTTGGDGCSATCSVEPGYICAGQPSVCTPVCGDGTIIAPETCDDGGTAAGDGCSSTCRVEPGYECTGQPSVCTALPFQCYRAQPGPPAGETVSLVDQFGTMQARVRRLTRLCNPADKNGETPGAPARPEHLTRYAISSLAGPATPRRVDVTNPFGTFRLDLGRPLALLVPAAKSLTPPPPAPLPTGAIDHFTCYEVFRAEGTRIGTQRVDLRDELGAQSFRVTRPDELCAPADKNGGTPGAETHAEHLLCYVLKRTGPRLTPPTVFETDQFASGPVDLLTTKQRLCVPSTKVVLP